MATLEQIITALQSPDAKIRQNAVVVLVKSKNPKVLPYLERVAAADSSEQVKMYALKGIEYIKKNAPSASSSAAQSKSAPVAPASAPAVPQIQKEPVQPAAIAAPQIPEIPEKYEYLKKYVESEFKDEVLYGIQAIREYDVRGYLPAVLACLNRFEESDVKAAVLSVMGIFGNASYLKLFLQYISHIDSIVRLSALESIDLTGDVSVVPDVIHSLKDSDPKCRAAAETVIKKYGIEPVMEQIKLAIQNLDENLAESSIKAASLFGAAVPVSVYKKLHELSFPKVKAEIRKAVELLAKDYTHREARDFLEEIKTAEGEAVSGDDIFERLSNISKNKPDVATKTPTEDDMFERLSKLKSDM